MEFEGVLPTQPASTTPENLHHKPRPRSPGSSSAVAEARFRENLLEGFPELGVEDGVDDWVEEGVDVAQPDEEGEQHLVRVAGRVVLQLVADADGVDIVDGEERHPTQQEPA